MKSLELSFFARDTVQVARDLLGKVLVVGGFQGRIVETEAYSDDAASHGRTRTGRSAIMHDTHGHIYVYLIYGMYYCLNFTTDHKVGAVLIRAVEPLNKIEILQRRRNTKKQTNLCSGPGKLCQAFGITKQYDGTKVGGKISVLDDGYVVQQVGSSGRIGIKEAKDLQWRFFIAGNKFVSC